MGPNGIAQQHNHRGRASDKRVAINRFPGKYGNDLGNNGKRRQGKYIDLGVTKYPKEMLPKHRVTTTGRFKKSGSQPPVDQQHRQS